MYVSHGKGSALYGIIINALFNLFKIMLSVMGYALFLFYEQAESVHNHS